MCFSHDGVRLVTPRIATVFVRIVYYMPAIANPRLDRGDALDWGQR